MKYLFKKSIKTWQEQWESVAFHPWPVSFLPPSPLPAHYEGPSTPCRYRKNTWHPPHPAPGQGGIFLRGAVFSTFHPPLPHPSYLLQWLNSRWVRFVTQRLCLGGSILKTLGHLSASPSSFVKWGFHAGRSKPRRSKVPWRLPDPQTGLSFREKTPRAVAQRFLPGREVGQNTLSPSINELTLFATGCEKIQNYWACGEKQLKGDW